MAELVVEVLARGGSHVKSRHRFNDFPIRIGRGYHNDLQLDDPYVSAHHLQIDAEPDQWLIEDLGSENGLFVGPQRNPTKRARIFSGEIIEVGETILRLLSPHHPIPPARPLPTGGSIVRRIGQPSIAWPIFFATLIMLVVDEYLGTYKTIAVEKLISGALPVGIIVLLWSGAWAFIGRLLKQRASFCSQLAVTSLVIIGSMLFSNLVSYISFGTNSSAAGAILSNISDGILLATLIYANLKIATSSSKQFLIWISHGTAWGIILSIAVMHVADRPEFSSQPEFSASLKPPFARLSRVKSLPDFLERAEEAFPKFETADEKSPTTPTD